MPNHPLSAAAARHTIEHMFEDVAVSSLTLPPSSATVPPSSASASSPWRETGSGAEALRGPSRGGGGRARAWIAELSDVRTLVAVSMESDRELVDRLRELEELKAAAAALQARAAAALDRSVRTAHAAAGLPADQQGRGVAAQVALARRESPARGGRILGFARALTTEMPCTLAALSQGRISEWRATLLVRETACLTVEDRRTVDAEVAGNPADLEGLGDGRLIARVRKITCRLDQQALIRRAAKAESERYVSCRPAPDTMTYVTGLLPVAQGVAVYAALSRVADSLRACGDARSRGQIMADTMVERITGQARAETVPLEVQLVMTDRSLLAADDEPAYLAGYGVVPSMWARTAVRRAGTVNPEPGATQGPGRGASAAAGNVPPGAARTPRPAVSDASTGVVAEGPGSSERSRGSEGPRGSEASVLWLRRLYAEPSTGELAAMDSKARFVSAGLARFIIARDRTCRTPWCDAPIRHHDHVLPSRSGGATRAENLQGLCEACNQAKEAPGWKASAGRVGAVGAGAGGAGGAVGAVGAGADGAGGAGGARADGDAGMGAGGIDGAGSSGGVGKSGGGSGRHTVTVTTPTGHTYHSTAPPLPGSRRPG